MFYPERRAVLVAGDGFFARTDEQRMNVPKAVAAALYVNTGVDGGNAHVCEGVVVALDKNAHGVLSFAAGDVHVSDVRVGRSVVGAEFDVDAILTVTPYYNKPSQAGLIAHYKAFTSATDMPVFLYNVPARTSCNLEAATTLRIIEECPNVVGIKEASGMMKQILQLLAKRPDGFLVISGDDLLTLPLMAAGADGLISVMANAFPAKVADMVHYIMNQELDEARKIHQQLVPLTVDCFKEGSPAGVKAIMSAMGLIDNSLRLPLVPVSEKLQEEIEKLVAQ